MAEREETEEQESQHWADTIAKEVQRRVEADEVLQAIVKERGYIIYDEKTPSGKIHIGSGRGWIIHDAIAKAMRDLGLNARFILSSDDIDPFDRMNAELPKEYEKYLGLPFMNIPSPVPGYKSFAEYYFKSATEKFPEFGINAELESTGERYIRGDFNRTIKSALDNAEKINAIYERFYGKAPEKLPFNPICDKCGKIGTTVAYQWDAKREIVKYRCSETLVKWAKGCCHEGEKSPYNGGGKLPWKVEWAAKWPTVGVVCETAGKDHFTLPGGSRAISVAISNEVFDFPPPYPSSRNEVGDGYEFFTIQGRKMSTSKGEGIGFANATEFAPGNILRYLLIATRPRAVIDFDPINRNDLILLYERYDKTERIYFGAEEGNPHEVQKHSRIYELSHIGEIPGKLPPQVSFTHAALVLQSAGSEEKAIEILKEQGKIPEKLDEEDKRYLHDRLSFARKWLDSFAPEQYKFQLQDKVHMHLADKEKELFRELKELLRHGSFTEEELHTEFYNLCQEFGYDAKEFFKKAYQLLINKERGPKLASFILAIGKDRVVRLLEQIH
ncbi:lysine--tRNA ligase [Candidatus Woesearchaeota archaeon]|nr:lysine--tRNA ligase [Candidatus Woesearchaeota archaeon]